MYKKVLYNIKKLEKCVCVWGGGGGEGEYASMVWSPHTDNLDKGTEKVEMVQRKAIRWTMNNYSPYASDTDMQNKLCLRYLEQRWADARLIMLYKIIHGIVIIPLPSY